MYKQTPRGGRLSVGARVKQTTLFRYSRRFRFLHPTASVYILCPPWMLVAPYKEHNQQRESKTSSCSCAILPIAKAWPRQDLCTNSSQIVARLWSLVDYPPRHKSPAHRYHRYRTNQAEVTNSAHLPVPSLALPVGRCRYTIGSRQ
jgi:hypothetical protein